MSYLWEPCRARSEAERDTFLGMSPAQGGPENSDSRLAAMDLVHRAGNHTRGLLTDDQ